MILSDAQIAERAIFEDMIIPFEPIMISSRTTDDPYPGSTEKCISYGLSSYGYDVRLADEFKIFTPFSPKGHGLVDPKNFDPASYMEYKGLRCVIPPHSFVLGHTVETFKIPRDILVICIGKSTYARSGIIVNVTPLEPEWRGQVTIEISNTSPLPAVIYANEGISQFIFMKASQTCTSSYADRNGKYQDQKGVTLPR